MDEFNKLKQSTELLGSDFIAELTKQLINLDKKASGDLLRSLDYEVIEVIGKLMIKLKANSYLEIVDKGRRPGAKPPPTTPIKKWIEQRGIRGRDKKGRFITNQSLAFVMARSIGKKGIKPTNVIQTSINNVIRMKSELLSKSAREDILSMVDIMLKNDFK